MNKGIINRISKLEILFPVAKFDTNELLESIINELETILQYKIKDRIKLSKTNYLDEDTLYREIFGFLTKKELRIIAYMSNRKSGT